jgi:hypothetical protein
MVEVENEVGSQEVKNEDMADPARGGVEFRIQKDGNVYPVNPRLPLLLVNKQIFSEMRWVAPPGIITLDISGAPEDYKTMRGPWRQLWQWFRMAHPEEKKNLISVRYNCSTEEIDNIPCGNYRTPGDALNSTLHRLERLSLNLAQRLLERQSRVRVYCREELPVLRAVRYLLLRIFRLRGH